MKPNGKMVLKKKKGTIFFFKSKEEHQIQLLKPLYISEADIYKEASEEIKNYLLKGKTGYFLTETIDFNIESSMVQHPWFLTNALPKEEISHYKQETKFLVTTRSKEFQYADLPKCKFYFIFPKSQTITYGLRFSL